MMFLVTLGRVLLGISFAVDGAWWLWTWEVRAAYLENAGAPSFVIPVVAAIYLVAGTLLALGRAARPAILALIAVVGLITMLVHTDLGPGGIGEYPIDAHGRINMNQLLLQAGLAGALMLAFASPTSSSEVDLRTVILGRTLMGIYFLAHGLYLALYYDTVGVHLGGASMQASLLPLTIGTQVVCGPLLAAGRTPRATSIALGLVVAWGIAVSGVMEPGEARAQHWFTGGALLAGLSILLGLGRKATPLPRASTDQP